MSTAPGIPDSLFPFPIRAKEDVSDYTRIPEWEEVEEDPDERDRDALSPPRYTYLGERTIRENVSVVLPQNLKKFGISAGTHTWVYWDMEYGRIVLTPQIGICIFCGSRTSKRFRGKFVCTSCFRDLLREYKTKWEKPQKTEP